MALKLIFLFLHLYLLTSNHEVDAVVTAVSINLQQLLVCMIFVRIKSLAYYVGLLGLLSVTGTITFCLYFHTAVSSNYFLKIAPKTIKLVAHKTQISRFSYHHILSLFNS